MVALRTGSVRGIGIWTFVLVAGCGGNARSSGDPVNVAGSLPSAAGNASSGAGSSTGGSAGAAGLAASQAGTASIAGAAHAGSPSVAGSGGSAHGGNVGGGGSAQGGNVGSGGSAPGGNAGTLGAAGSSGGAVNIGAAAKAACSRVCSKFSSTPQSSCASIGDLGPSCQSDCSNTFAIQNGDCTELGLEMTTCLTSTTPSPNFSDCWIRFYDVSQQCYREVGAYQKCVADRGATLPPALCAQISTVGPSEPTPGVLSTCKEDRKCLNNLNYKVDCSDTTDHQSSCSCDFTVGPMHQQVSTDFVWLDTTAHACKDALPSCLASAMAMNKPAP